MKKRPILKCLYIISISLLVILTAASCDEDNNMMSGDNDDKPLNGDGGVDPTPTPMPTPMPTFSPVLGFSGVGIDYDPEARCSTNNWSTDFPVACNPQLGFTCPMTGKTLDNCPSSCQSCYDSDLGTIKDTLSVDTITIYQPNYYILTAAKAKSVKVVLGLFNDTVAALASRHCSNDMSTMCATNSDCTGSGTCTDDTSGCTYAGSPSVCGTAAANSLLNGACGSTTPWPPATFCDGAGNTYITPNADFITDGTVIGIQVGNEVLSSEDPTLTKAEVQNAAKVLKNAISSNSLTAVPMIVSLEVGNEQSFCEDGAPPDGVDLIAAHPYCDFVASVPPSWPDESGNTAEQAAEMCWTQVKSLFIDNAVKYCGAANTYIGETGYNTGCPGDSGESGHLAVTPHFVDDFVSWSCTNNTGSFLFAFVDACPMGGCKAGCSSSDTTAGNGYFGLYHTDMYDTMGSLTAKYSPLPTLTCP